MRATARRCGRVVGLLGLAACASPPATAIAPQSRVSADEGMVLVPTATFVLGHDGSMRADEGPPHAVTVSAFYVDATLVTRAAFARFVRETGYVTTAETLGYGLGSSEGMGDWEWERIPHASWRRPYWEETADTAAFLADDAPVVMVSYVDADSFCRHAGKRLPTEAEWERAMGAGASDTRYPWGDDPERSKGKYGLNFWQGASHRHNARLDGYVYVSPVRAFAPNAFGIFDPVGNVWQWTSDWYAPDAYAREAASGTPVDPKGPSAGAKRVLRGGSWWCGPSTCEGNGLFYRGKAAPDAPFSNNGFRCVATATGAPP